MKDAITLSMLTSPRQYFADLNILIFCFDFLAATNTNWLCILLLPTDCSLSAIKKSCIIHSHSKTTLLKRSRLNELQFRVLEFFCYLKTWSTQKANALSRQRLLVPSWETRKRDREYGSVINLKELNKCIPNQHFKIQD